MEKKDFNAKKIIASGTVADLVKELKWYHTIAKPPYVFNDGGRAEAGYLGRAGDCVPRAIAIALEIPYYQVYVELTKATKRFSETHRCKVAKAIKRSKKFTPADGVYKKVWHEYILSKGWKWKTHMTIGAGTTVHLDASELPSGRIIAQVSKHICAMIDGEIHDTSDPSRNGTRCVYGHYYNPNPKE